LTSSFAPEFLILLGIDIFLGASILTVLLDRHFPGPLPYVLEGASLIGFAELMAGPTFLNSFSTELQFYYSFTYALLSVLTLFATNLYLLFLRRKPFESAILGICGTIPAGLGILYFTSAFVNGLSLSLPLVPVIPIEGVYAMFGLSIGLIVFSLLMFGRKARPVGERQPATEKPMEQPVLTRASGSGQALLVQEPPPSAPVESSSVQPLQGPVTPSQAESPPAVGPDTSKSEPVVSGAPVDGTAVMASSPQEPGHTEEPDVQNAGTVLVEKPVDPTYKDRLVDSIRFFQKAVDHPVRIDPKWLRGSVKDVKRVYLTPAGMVMAENSKGKTVTLSLMELSTDEALNIMTEAMRQIEGGGSTGQ
jgi:hypothetical protein